MSKHRFLDFGWGWVVMGCSNNFNLGGICEYQSLGLRSANGDYIIWLICVAKRGLRDQSRKRFKGYKLRGLDVLSLSGQYSNGTHPPTTSSDTCRMSLANSRKSNTFSGSKARDVDVDMSTSKHTSCLSSLSHWFRPTMTLQESC